MTSRVQTLRSSTTGNVPVAGTRQPGELWVNFADFQAGFIDASRNAQRLVAVRYFQTTANYAAGDIVVQAGAIWVANGAITAGAFNASNWSKVASDSDIASSVASYLPLAGGTLTGALVLAADPGAALGAATKQYVDNKAISAGVGVFLPLAGGTLTGPLVLPGNPAAPLQAVPKQYVDALPVAMNVNRIINGDMRINQRNAAISGAAGGYIVDRWAYGTAAAVGTAQGVATAAMAPNGFPYCLNFTSSSAHVSVAIDSFFFYQNIEADMISDFAWGTANAQPVTLSFWVNATVAGTYSGAINNLPSPPTRCYPFSFTVPVGWTKVIINIPGDTAGTWVMSGNAGGVGVKFDLGSGTTFRGPAGAWVNGNFNGVTGAAQVTATNGAVMQITGVKLEVGSVATPFNRQTMAKSMADCQRYYYSGPYLSAGYNTASGVVYQEHALPVTMRATPTITFPTSTPSNSSALNTSGINLSNFNTQYNVTATGGSLYNFTITASAEI
jgi:hypothetical protein